MCVFERIKELRAIWTQGQTFKNIPSFQLSLYMAAEQQKQMDIDIMSGKEKNIHQIENKKKYHNNRT